MLPIHLSVTCFKTTFCRNFLPGSSIRTCEKFETNTFFSLSLSFSRLEPWCVQFCALGLLLSVLNSFDTSVILCVCVCASSSERKLLFSWLTIELNWIVETGPKQQAHTFFGLSTKATNFMKYVNVCLISSNLSCEQRFNDRTFFFVAVQWSSNCSYVQFYCAIKNYKELFRKQTLPWNKLMWFTKYCTK